MENAHGKDQKFYFNGNEKGYNNISCTLNNRTLIITANTEDNNKNKIALSSDGFSISDSSNNKIVSSSSGLTITDKNSKKIEMSASGTVINGKLTVL